MAAICVIGAWHQASVLAGCFAELGHTVTGVWPDAQVVASLQSGKAPVHEPGLDALLARQLHSGRLRFSTDYAEALRGAAFAFLAIDTPVAEDDAPELDIVRDAALEVGRALSNDVVLCVSAQVPVGTCERIGALVDGAGVWRCVVAYVPEFLRLGTALETFREADRIVIGCDDDAAARDIAALYADLARPVVITDVRSAEMAKHACNAFLATSISFINEIANVCEVTGAQLEDVVRVMKLDRRIGAHAFLSPGMGFAGGTLGRDVRALQSLADGETPLLDAVMRVNAERAAVVATRLERELGGLREARVGVLGLTYKPGTSTLRRSVALDVISGLVARGAEVRACDPLADFSGVPDLPDFALCDDATAAAEGADALVLLTEWPALRDLDLSDIARRMRRPLLLDTRNFFDAEGAVRAGLRYLGMGRAPSRGHGEGLAAGVPA